MPRNAMPYVITTATTLLQRTNHPLPAVLNTYHNTSHVSRLTSATYTMGAQGDNSLMQATTTHRVGYMSTSLCTYLLTGRPGELQLCCQTQRIMKHPGTESLGMARSWLLCYKLATHSHIALAREQGAREWGFIDCLFYHCNCSL